MTQRSNPYDDPDDGKPSVNSPRGRHQERDRDDPAIEPDSPNPKPDCSSGTVETEWKTRSVTGALLAFFDPCSDCFPDGEIRCSTVVRSRNQHASYVHLLNGATNSPASQPEGASISPDVTDDELARTNGAHTGGRQ